MENENILQLQEKFLTSDYCERCGSQRCDGTLEWLEGCPHWKQFIKNYLSCPRE